MLTKRPLLNTAADQRLFVRDASRERAIKSAFQRSNTLIVGEAGSGKTSLLYNVRANADETSAPEVILIDARVAFDPRDVIDILLKEAVADGWVEAAERPDRDDPFALVSQIRRLRDASDGSMILLDDPDAEQAATLFGRLRDELWQLPVWFTVAVNPSTYTSVLSQPPANAFFDTVIELEPLEPDAAVEMLRRRKHRGQLAEAIVTPAQAMQPRAVLLSAEAGPSARYDVELQHDLLTRAEQVAGRPGAALVAEIWNRGAVSASDAELQRRLGVSRARLTQLLTLLANEGALVSTSQAASGAVGRPRTLYDINRVG
jgi:hypothetical protein